MPKITSPAVLAALALAACDPTGNTSISTSSVGVRLADFVVDAPALNLTTGGVLIHGNIAFGQLSGYKLVGVDDSVFVVRRTSDAFLVGTDTFHLIEGRKYTYYALGEVTGFKPRLAVDDTIFAVAGATKIRFIHGVGARALQALDFYVSLTSDSIVDISPLVPALAYGSASPYLSADTGFRRMRITLAGQTTAIFDTTFTTPSTDSAVVTIVATDKQGGGAPVRVQRVVDRTP